MFPHTHNLLAPRSDHGNGNDTDLAEIPTRPYSSTLKVNEAAPAQPANTLQNRYAQLAPL